MNLWTPLTRQNNASVSVVFMEVCPPRGVCGAVWTEGRRAHQQQGVSHQELLGWAPCRSRPQWRSLFKSLLNGSMGKLLLGGLHEIHTFGTYWK